MNTAIRTFDFLHISPLIGSAELGRQISTLTQPYTMLALRPVNEQAAAQAFDRMVHYLDNPQAGLCFFGSYFLPGSVRDDFDFGPVLLAPTAVLKQAAGQLTPSNYAAFYQLWLEIKSTHNIVPIDEDHSLTLHSPNGEEGSKSHFAYLDPRNRQVQTELEFVFARYLHKVNALLKSGINKVDIGAEQFPVEASIIIPVKNRRRTIAQALDSALAQRTAKPYNVLVVDNHSTDGTTEIIADYARADARIVHIIPTGHDLEIGGCWNLAAAHACCGRFSVQLDSDDVYSSDLTLQTILDVFHHKSCGMVVGSYTLTDIDLHIIPPGLIDHAEWTDRNGANNLLRVNGIGAPRAFYTPLLRRHPAPNVSYGEDYALALTFSRLYPVGRIYDSIYFCRRWTDNTDANPDPALTTARNKFKDELRTRELNTRIAMNTP